MRAIVYRKYGTPDELKLVEIPKPVPKDNEVLIKIHASTVTMGDCEMRAFRMPPLVWLPVRIMFGLFRPKHKVLGQELSGTIEAIGSEVTTHAVGDKVFAPTQMKLGAYAEYICLPADHAIAPKPTNMSFEEAATLSTGGLNALYFLRKANIQKGEHVVIVGAGGSIGTYAIQLAKHYGAEVTAVDNTFKLDMLRKLGADHVIDYTKKHFTENKNTYDVIFDIVCKNDIKDCLASMKEGGRLLAANIEWSRLVRSMKKNLAGNKTVLTGVADYSLKDAQRLSTLAEEGVLKAVIDKRYPLDEVPDAHRYVDKDLKAGHVVIKIV